MGKLICPLVKPGSLPHKTPRPVDILPQTLKTVQLSVSLDWHADDSLDKPVSLCPLALETVAKNTPQVAVYCILERISWAAVLPT